MITRFAVVLLFLAAAGTELRAQSNLHSWKVIASGGGKGTRTGGVTLHSSIGQSAVGAASQGGDKLESGYIPGVQILTGLATTFDQQISETWNMLSVPLVVNDFSRVALYPHAISSAFEFQGGYQAKTTLVNGVGYWLKFSADTSATIVGTRIPELTINVNDKWNMIGTPSWPVPVASGISVNGGTVVSSFFGYSTFSGYFMEDTLQPGLAYWVKMSGSGQLTLDPFTSVFPPSSMAGALPDEIHGRKTGVKNWKKLLGIPQSADAAKFDVTDQRGQTRSVYVIQDLQKELKPGQYELPPVAPGDIFDLRFSTNRIAEVVKEDGTANEVGLILTKAQYPVEIAWVDVEESENSHIELLVNGGETILVKGNGSVKVISEKSGVTLRIVAGKKTELPTKFSLEQNYPNPFNPVTTIRYALPVASNVTLKIYDVLGQEVATLVEGIQEAGFKEVEWDASNAATGIYYYRITAMMEADAFTVAKKMMLVK